jgi:hypothetical protein
MTVTRRETIARAIYMTHWGLPEESKRGLDPRIPPPWENVSGAVREWVLAQADAAIEAYEADVASHDEAA